MHILSKLREAMKEQLIASFIQNIEALGFTTAEMVDYLTKRGVGND